MRNEGRWIRVELDGNELLGGLVSRVAEQSTLMAALLVGSARKMVLELNVSDVKMSKRSSCATCC